MAGGKRRKVCAILISSGGVTSIYSMCLFLSCFTAGAGDLGANQLFPEVCCATALISFVPSHLCVQQTLPLPSSYKHYLADISIYAHLNQLLL